MTQATNATSNRMTATPANVAGSRSGTSNNKLDSVRLSAAAATRPMATPASATSMPSPTTSRSTPSR